MARGGSASLCAACAPGKAAVRGGAAESADAVRGIDGAIAVTPRSIASTGTVRRSVPFDGAGAVLDGAVALFDGVIVTESILARSEIGHKA